MSERQSEQSEDGLHMSEQEQHQEQSQQNESQVSSGGETRREWTYGRRNQRHQLMKEQREEVYLTPYEKLEKSYNQKIVTGPVFVCCVCEQTWFRCSVKCVDNVRFSSQVERDVFDKVNTGRTSVDGKSWVCTTCCCDVKKKLVPKLSIANGMGFPEVPDELKIHLLEERLVSPRIPFFQMRDLPVGGQKSVKGNVVNVPVKPEETVPMLPRTWENSQTCTIRIKRRMQYKKCEFRENV